MAPGPIPGTPKNDAIVAQPYLRSPERCQVHPVRHLEHLRPELQRSPIRQLRIFEQRQIRIHKAQIVGFRSHHHPRREQVPFITRPPPPVPAPPPPTAAMAGSSYVSLGFRKIKVSALWLATEVDEGPCFPVSSPQASASPRNPNKTNKEVLKTKLACSPHPTC